MNVELNETNLYVAVEWPEYQCYMEHKDFRERCFYSADNDIYFIPVDIYKSIN
jgi:hypothetical protein